MLNSIGPLYMIGPVTCNSSLSYMTGFSISLLSRWDVIWKLVETDPATLLQVLNCLTIFMVVKIGCGVAFSLLSYAFKLYQFFDN